MYHFTILPAIYESLLVQHPCLQFNFSSSSGYVVLALLCISLIANEVEHLFIYIILPSICSSLFKICLTVSELMIREVIENCAFRVPNSHTMTLIHNMQITMKWVQTVSLWKYKSMREFPNLHSKWSDLSSDSILSTVSEIVSSAVSCTQCSINVCVYLLINDLISF